MKRLTLLVLVVIMVAVGCRESGSDAEPPAPTSTSMDSMDSTDGMDSMDSMDGGMNMNMGDPTATPAEDVVGADVVTGVFALLDTRPQGYDDVAGSAALARHDGGTTVTIRLDGLKPDVSFISHVHVGSCDDYGGDHYRFDPAGSDMPPNEIHLAFESSSDGSGFMTAENAQTVDERAVSVVIHPRELLDNKIACAEFSG